MADNADVINRVVAIIIDSIILGVVMMILALPLGFQAMMMQSFSDPMAAMSLWATTGILSLIGIVITFGYFVYFEGTAGQTIGKKIVNIKVVREDGKPMTYMEALIRTILRVVDSMGLYLLGLIIILVSEKQQRLGDMAAKTLVVKA